MKNPGVGNDSESEIPGSGHVSVKVWGRNMFLSESQGILGTWANKCAEHRGVAKVFKRRCGI